MELTNKINKIRELIKGSEKETEIDEILDELSDEVKPAKIKTRGDPVVEMF